MKNNNEKNVLKEQSISMYENRSSSLTIYKKEWLTSDEAASYLSISTSRLMNLLSLGKVPYYKFGRSNRYLVSELKALLMSQPKGERHGS